ncbi:MAG: hypothetical protein PWP16_152 [Eubacteriaceae bacterium]|jgi:hypothetical protein|nr:hypothetical protein [Eubacteriaceae bacterium]MDN5306789.1 hypothetical protein [Eubacteriaceae bacterium]
MEVSLRDDAAIEEQRKDKLPYEHYKSLLKDYDPKEIEKLSSCLFDEEAQVFVVRVMGSDYRVSYPDGLVKDNDNQEFNNYKLKTMILRFLMNAKGVRSTGQDMVYRDVSGGNAYFACFEGRCLKRFAFTFNYNPDGLKKAMAAIGAQTLDKGDLSFKFEFVNDMFMTVILWLGDDEFPPAAQILFDKNFESAFSAEDMAVMGDIFIPILKGLSK